MTRPSSRWTSYIPSSSASQTSIRAPGSGSPSVPRTVPSTQAGSPGAPPERSPPFSISGASPTKNGPNTVASVASPTASLFTATVCMETPSTSLSSTNSWRYCVVMWPTRVRKSIAAFHSGSVSRTVRT